MQAYSKKYGLGFSLVLQPYKRLMTTPLSLSGSFVSHQHPTTAKKLLRVNNFYCMLITINYLREKEK